MDEATKPTPESISEPTQEMIQHSDGQIGLYFRTVGDTFDWSSYSETQTLTDTGYNSLALVQTYTGIFAIGNNAIVKVIDYDWDTRKFTKIEEGKRPAMVLTELVNGDELPKAKIGYPWEPLRGEGRLLEIVVSWKTSNIPYPGAHQVDRPSNFDEYRDILHSYTQSKAT